MGTVTAKPRKEPRDRRLTLRIPSSLHERIQEAADADHRSISGWAIAVFEAVLREQQSKRK